MKSIRTLAAALACCLLFSVAAYPRGRAGSDGTFNKSWEYYRKRVLQGANLQERQDMLDRILAKYTGRKFNERLGAVRTERNFVGSLEFYDKKVAEGAQFPERLEILDRIRGKYLGRGVDLSRVDREMDAIYAKMPPPQAPPDEMQAEPLLSAPTEQAPVTVPEVVVSTPEPVAELTVPSTEEPKERTSKYFGVEAKAFGGLGMLGYQGIVNISDTYACTIGYGNNPVSMKEKTGTTASGSRTSYLGLFRYGIGNFYAASGVSAQMTSGEVRTMGTSVSTSISNYGIPLVIGIQTGSKRLFFFNLEAGYVGYFGATSTTASVVDPSSGDTISVTVDPPESGPWIGIGVGVFIF